jgi:hypothetical protein
MHGMKERRRTCPDCGGPLSPVRLYSSSKTHHALDVAAADAEPNWFTGFAKTLGTVGAELCAACRRILLYAEGLPPS